MHLIKEDCVLDTCDGAPGMIGITERQIMMILSRLVLSIRCWVAAARRGWRGAVDSSEGLS